MVFRSSKAIFLTIGLLLVFVLAFYAFWIEPTSLTIKAVTIPIRGLNHPIRAVLIGDPQPMKPFWPAKRIQWAMEQAQAQKPDIVFFVGDYAYEHHLLRSLHLTQWLMVNPADTVEAMARIHAPLGSYAVLGNHDWWWNGPEMIRLLNKTHIRLLRDQSVYIHSGSTKLWVAGLDDMAPNKPYDIAAMLAKTNNQAPIVLLAHSPDVFPSVPQQVALTLAGHTHGGQVYIPFIGRPIVPIQHKKYAYGYFNENGHQLFVTSGIGISIIPIRFLTPPEIVVLNLIPSP